MLDTLFWVALGAFVGWNFPQPFWAKIIQEWEWSQFQVVRVIIVINCLPRFTQLLYMKP